MALTDRGEDQARATGEALAAVPFARCLVSDLGRARRTAALILGERRLPVHVEPALRERHMGVLAGVRLDDARADGRIERWILPWHAAPPGGESHADVARRAMAALRAWDDGRPTLVVSHGSLLADLVGLLDGLDPERLGEGKPAAHATPIVRVLPRGLGRASMAHRQ